MKKSPFRKLILSPTEMALIQDKKTYNKVLRREGVRIIKDSKFCYDSFGFIFFEWLEVSDDILKSI